MPVLPNLISQLLLTVDHPSSLIVEPSSTTTITSPNQQHQSIQLLQQQQQGAGARYYGLIVSVSSLAQLFLAPIVGQLSDRKFGRRTPLAFFLYFISIYYLMLGFSAVDWMRSLNTPAVNVSLFVVFLAKLISGCCGHVILLSLTYISDISTAKTKAQNFGLLGVATGLAFTIGPATGGYLSSHVHFESPFFISAILQFGNALFVTFGLRDTWKPPSNISNNHATIQWRILLNPLRSFRIFLTPKIRNSIMPMALSLVLLTTCQQSFHTVWVLYARHRFDWNSFHSGMFMTFTGVCTILVQGYVIRSLIPAFGEQVCASLGLGMSVLINIAVALIPSGWMLYFIFPITSLEGLAVPSLQSLIVKLANTTQQDEKLIIDSPEQDSIQGAIQGSISSLQILSKVVASVLATQLFSYGTTSTQVESPGLSFLLGAILSLFALVTLNWNSSGDRTTVARSSPLTPAPCEL